MTKTECYLRNKHQVKIILTKGAVLSLPSMHLGAHPAPVWGTGSFHRRLHASPSACAVHGGIPRVAILWILYSHALCFSNFLVHFCTPRGGNKQMQRYKPFCSLLRSVHQVGRKAGSPIPPFAQLLFMILVLVVSPHLLTKWLPPRAASERC